VTPIAEWQETFVEQFGLLGDVGLPRSVTRVLGWLVVCQPRHQPAEQLQSILRLSAGSVSAATTMLVRAEIVERVTFPGDRRIYYQLPPEGWHRLIRTRVQLLARARQVAEQALDAAGEQGDERLTGMRDFYGELEADLVRLLDEHPGAGG
jgi:DNA-binding transcriptional regulator GbsR (MarR family)